MKKAPLSPRRQARRQRALERFTILSRTSFQDEAAYKAYLQRKQAEETALRARLGHNTLA